MLITKCSLSLHETFHVVLSSKQIKTSTETFFRLLKINVAGAQIGTIVQYTIQLQKTIFCVRQIRSFKSSLKILGIVNLKGTIVLLR